MGVGWGTGLEIGVVAEGRILHGFEEEKSVLGSGGEEHENTDENEAALLRQQETQGDKGSGDVFSDFSGNAGGFESAFAGCEVSAQHPSAIHGEVGQQIEEEQDQVDAKRNASDVLKEGQWQGSAESDEQCGEQGEGEADQRSGEGDADLLPGIGGGCEQTATPPMGVRMMSCTEMP